MNLWSSKPCKSSKSCKRNLIKPCILSSLLATVFDLLECFSPELLWFSAPGLWKVSRPNFLELKHIQVDVCIGIWHAWMLDGYLKAFVSGTPELTCGPRTPEGFSKEISYFKSSILFWCVGDLCRGAVPQGDYINQQRVSGSFLCGLGCKPLAFRFVFSHSASLLLRKHINPGYSCNRSSELVTQLVNWHILCFWICWRTCWGH